MPEPLRTAYSLPEIADKLKHWMCDQWGANPKDLKPHHRAKWHEQEGMIYAFLREHFPTDNQD